MTDKRDEVRRIGKDPSRCTYADVLRGAAIEEREYAERVAHEPELHEAEHTIAALRAEVQTLRARFGASRDREDMAAEIRRLREALRDLCVHGNASCLKRQRTRPVALCSACEKIAGDHRPVNLNADDEQPRYVCYADMYDWPCSALDADGGSD